MPGKAVRRLTHPREFLAEYVDPALQAWSTNQSETHFAVHALAQLDILAEVTFNYLAAHASTGHKTSKSFRDDLGMRHPTLGTIRNAHDSHKHGALGRATATNFRSGQRPENAQKAGFFVDHTPVDGPLTEYQEMILELDDGSEISVGRLILDGRRLWDYEFHNMNL